MTDDTPPRMGSRADLQRRLDGYGTFAAWEREQVIGVPPERAIEIATGLYDLLPPASRRRPIDPSGVGRMQRLLRVLMPSR